MSCNGCRVLRKGCSDTCVLRHCLRWIDSADAQGHATVFVAKFFGRAGMMSLVSSVAENQRPALFQSLLFEACGRTINPVFGAVGLLCSGNWELCQDAVNTVLRGDLLCASLGSTGTGRPGMYGSSSVSRSYNQLRSVPSLKRKAPEDNAAGIGILSCNSNRIIRRRVQQISGLDFDNSFLVKNSNNNSSNNSSSSSLLKNSSSSRSQKSKLSSSSSSLVKCKADPDQVALDLTLGGSWKQLDGESIKRTGSPCPSEAESATTDMSVSALVSSDHLLDLLH